MPEANQKEMAVLRAEIQIETRRSSTPSFLAINMPPPTVTIQTGHWAETGATKIKKFVTKIKKNIIDVMS